MYEYSTYTNQGRGSGLAITEGLGSGTGLTNSRKSDKGQGLGSGTGLNRNINPAHYIIRGINREIIFNSINHHHIHITRRWDIRIRSYAARPKLAN